MLNFEPLLYETFLKVLLGCCITKQRGARRRLTYGWRGKGGKDPFNVCAYYKNESRRKIKATIKVFLVVHFDTQNISIKRNYWRLKW